MPGDAVQSEVPPAGSRQRGDYLRRWSYQLRGPLAAAHSMLSALEHAGPMNDQQVDLARRVRNRLAEVMQQLDEMRLLGELQRQAPQARASEDLAQALRDVAAELAGQARDRGVAMSAGADGALPVRAWPGALATMVRQLLDNAIKYTPAGGSVSARATGGDGSAVLDVVDTGIGVPPEQQCRLFTEFFRASNARQVAGGTGLGLAIVQAVARGLGGSVEFASGPAGGTKVRLTLPLEREK